MTEEQIKQIVRELIKEELVVDHETKETYTADMNGSGRLYTSYHNITVKLGDYIISEIDIES